MSEKMTYEELEQRFNASREKWEEIKRDYILVPKEKEIPEGVSLVLVDEQRLQELESYSSGVTALFQLIVYDHLQLPVIQQQARKYLKRAEKIVGHSLK